jgi:hypothetical protein
LRIDLNAIDLYGAGDNGKRCFRQPKNLLSLATRWDPYGKFYPDCGNFDRWARDTIVVWYIAAGPASDGINTETPLEKSVKPFSRSSEYGQSPYRFCNPNR